MTQTSLPHLGHHCSQNHQFWVTSDTGSSPVICGTNTGYHMIVTAREDCNTMTHFWTGGSTREWKIRISQISCTAEWRPPTDCLQWYTGTTGYIASFNYPGSYHLANQEYAICIRAEQGYCSIAYTQVSTTGFQMSGQNPPSASAVGSSCTQDYIIIMQGGSCPAPDTTTNDRFCGNLLAESTGATSATSVCTQKLPFMIGVKTDGTEVRTLPSPLISHFTFTFQIDAPPTPSTEYSAGFYIYYSQTSC